METTQRTGRRGQSRSRCIRRASRDSAGRRSGFTLVELLVVMSIISILIGLFMPAVQAAREAARRTQCQNNLRQIGVAVGSHEALNQRFPTGGWGWRWVADPDRGNDKNQPGGWIYSILPYMEQTSVHDLGKGQPLFNKLATAIQLQKTTVPGFNCPTRRDNGPFTHQCQVSVFNAVSLTQVDARSDYAANAGDFYVSMGPGPTSYQDTTYVWPSTGQMTGISYLCSEVRVAEITDGTSNTYLVGEKYLSTDYYVNGASWGDDYSMYQGADHDIHRWVAKNASTPWPPRPDSPGDDQVGDLNNMFGSAHPGVWNALFCDGSVHSIGYTINAEVHRRLGNRQDGQVMDVRF